ncbi:MAG: septum formation initiator family protein [Patescibacteria group bacterium]
MRKLILYGVILIQIAIVISLVRGIQLSKRTAGRIALLEDAKSKLLDEKSKLEEESRYVQSDFYLEKVAREELYLTKQGETVVIIPSERDLIPTESPNTSEKDNLQDRPNWKKWLKIFIGSD